MKHKYTSTKPPSPDPTKVGSVEWDQPHIIVGRPVSANYTCTADDDLIDATGGTSGITITPLPSPPDGTLIMVMKVDAGPGVVTVLGNINGNSNFPLTTQWQIVELQAKGGVWRVLRGAGTGSVSGAVLLSPAADQTIVGPYGLILNGGNFAVSGPGRGNVAGAPSLADFLANDGDSDWLSTWRAATATSGEVLTLEQNSFGDFFLAVKQADGALVNQIILRGVANTGNIRFGPNQTNGIAVSQLVMGRSTVSLDGEIVFNGTDGSGGVFGSIGGGNVVVKPANFSSVQRTQLLPNADGTIAVEVTPPNASNATGNPGSIAFDSSYIYACVAPSTWMRAALSSF